MKFNKFLILGVLASLTLLSTSAFAAQAKAYQVTGPVLEVTDTTLTVQKADDKWQIAIDKATAAKVKVGDKVTVYYQIVAKEVEVKVPATAVK